MADLDQQINELYQRAEQLRQAEAWDNVVTVCNEILALDEHSPQALEFLGNWNFTNENFEEAGKQLSAYNKIVPNQEPIMLTLAMALEENGEYDEACKILRRALKLNENNFFSYIYLGSVLEKIGEAEKAAWAYSFAVDLNPLLKLIARNKKFPKAARTRILRLNDFLTEIGQKLHKGAVDKARKKFPKGNFKRIEKASWGKLNRPRDSFTNPNQQPLNFYIPDLAPAAWFERENFPWVKDFEDEFPHLQKEVLAHYGGDADTLPYLQVGGYDQKAWGDLVGNKDWSAIHFYDGRERKEDNCNKFPEVVRVVDELPLFKVGDKPVEVLLSILKAGKKIPPHYGTSNARLTVHLPLLVPGDCFLEAGGEARQIQAGKAIFFDDSFTHLAWNDSDQIRIVLIFEVWHPDLSEEERAAVEASYIAYEAWMEGRDHDALLDG